VACLAAVRGPTVAGVEAAIVDPLQEVRLSEDDRSSFAYLCCHSAVAGDFSAEKCI